MSKRKQTPDIAKKLTRFGYDATINEDVSPEARQRDGLFVINLTFDGENTLKQNVIEATLLKQRADWVRRQNDPDYIPDHDEPSAPTVQQEVLYEVLKMGPLNFPVVLLDVDNSDDFMFFANTYFKQSQADIDAGKPPDEYQRDFVWSKWGIVKAYGLAKNLTRKRNTDDPPTFDPQTSPAVYNDDGDFEATSGLFNHRLIDGTVEDYNFETPCLIVFTRKAIYFASINFLDDTVPGHEYDADTPLGQIITAQDVYDVDPRVKAQVDARALRPTDGGLLLTLLKSALGTIGGTGPAGPAGPAGPPGQDGPAGPAGPPGQDGGTGDPGNSPPIDPTDPPPGVKPPPAGGNGTPQPGDGVGKRLDFNCETELVYANVGTNHDYALADFLWSNGIGFIANLGLQSFLSVWAQREPGASIYDGILAAIGFEASNQHLPATYHIDKIVLCVSFQRMKKVQVLADGVETPEKVDFDGIPVGNPIGGFDTFVKPTLRVQKGTTGYDKIVQGQVSTLGSYVLGANSVGISFKADCEIAKDEKVIITNFDDVTGIVWSGIFVPAVWDFWNSQPDVPIVHIGLESADIFFEVSNWQGHWNFDTWGTHVLENPHLAGQMLYFSDDPDGLVNGSVTGYTDASGFWHGGEVTGLGNIVLTGHNGFGFELGLIGKADGYVAAIDKAYTKCHVNLRGIWGAQDGYLQVHVSPGGTGTLFPVHFPDTGQFATSPFGLGSYTFEVDISSLNLQIGDTLSSISINGGFYLKEWSIYLY